MAEGENWLLPFVFWPLDIMHTWIDKCNNFLITWKLFPCRWIALFSWQRLLCHLLVANFFMSVRSLLSFSRGFPWLSWEERKEGYHWSWQPRVLMCSVLLWLHLLARWLLWSFPLRLSEMLIFLLWRMDGIQRSASCKLLRYHSFCTLSWSLYLSSTRSY